MRDLAYISATDALSAFRARTLSPVELLEAVKARADEVEPTINALCTVDFDRAFDAAREAEARYAGRGAVPRALEGLPVAIKEDQDIEGEPVAMGSLLLKDVVADHTGDVSSRILAAGGIVHTRTKMPEMGAHVVTRSRMWGVTRNPWLTTAAAGGSSGGSGAALASGMTTLAIGSDVGGSIRIPASFNGVVGYKPPFGRVPLDPPGNSDTFLHTGPMARSVRDTALLQNVIAGPSARDINSLRPAYTLPLDYPDVRGLRIAVSVDLGSFDVDPEIRSNTLEVAERLRQEGAVVDLVDLVLDRGMVLKTASLHYILQAGVSLAEYAKSDLVSPYIPAAYERFLAAADGGTVEQLDAMVADLYAPVGQLFETYDALITPTVATRAFDAELDYAGEDVLTIDGHDFTDPMMGVMTLPWNILSRCPVLAVPSGFADNGVPTGVQIVGPTYVDDVVFRVGAALEKQAPLFDVQERRPGFSAL